MLHYRMVQFSFQPEFCKQEASIVDFLRSQQVRAKRWYIREETDSSQNQW